MNAAELQPPPSTLMPYIESLFPAFQHYCTAISVADHALSLQACGYLAWLCETVRPSAITDLGSGFSSFVVRQYAARADHPVTVHSVDGDSIWLSRSSAFAAHYGLSTDGFMSGDEWRKYRTKYDVILNDYAGGDIRDEFAGLAADRLSTLGVIVFDDAHHYGHRDNMAGVCRMRGLALLDLFTQTVDGMGRHAMVGVRP